MSSSKRILVSGAGGFLGIELIRQLLDCGSFHVIALTSNPERLVSRFKSASQLTILSNTGWVNELPPGFQFEVLVNCAFPRTSDPKELASGIRFTENLIKDVLDLSVRKVINISTQSVYSQKSKSPACEKTPVVPESLYGMAKYACERIVATLCGNHRQSTIYSNIRLASLSGIGFDVRITNRFVKKALGGVPLTINGGGQKISYLDVEDAASAIIAMINSGLSLWAPTYNLGNDDYVTVLELAEIVREIGKEYSVHNVDFHIREGQDDFSNLINSDRFSRDFGWKSKQTMEMIVRELFEHYSLFV